MPPLLRFHMAWVESRLPHRTDDETASRAASDFLLTGVFG